MNWVREHTRSAVLVGLTLLLPLVLYLQVLMNLLGLAFDYSRERDRLEPRLARLSGLQESGELLEERRSAATASLATAIYPSSNDESALAAELQSSVRQVLIDSGLSVSNSQVLPIRDDEAFKKVKIKLTAGGTLAALDTALVGLTAHSPTISIESLDTFPARVSRRRARTGSRQEQALTVVMQVMALQSKS
ncbi:MAG: type II secretion system protein GspM [Pseudomonadota bacterium]